MATTKIDPKYRVKTRKELDLLRWESMSIQGAEKLLRDVDAATAHIDAARVNVGLRIADKELEMRKAWPTAKLQGMRYLAHDLHELRKEQALYERLLTKAETARAFLSERMAELKVLA